MTPARLTRPNVGIRPTTPHSDAGPRIDPPVSEPSAAGTEAGRDGGPRARGGAAGEVGEVPGVARGGPGQIERRPGVRHLVGRELAEQHRARVVEPGGRRGVGVGDPVEEDARVRGGEDAPRVVDVLEREGDPVQWAARRARGDLRLDPLRLLPRQIERAGDEGVRLAVVPLDALDEGLDQLDGRQRPRRDQAGELGDREVVKINCHGRGPPRVCPDALLPRRSCTPNAIPSRPRAAARAPVATVRVPGAPGAAVDSGHAAATPRGRGDPGRGAGGLRSRPRGLASSGPEHVTTSGAATSTSSWRWNRARHRLPTSNGSGTASPPPWRISART